MPEFKSIHTYVSEGGHDLIVKVCDGGVLVVKQGEGAVVLSPEDVDNLSTLVKNRAVKP